VSELEARALAALDAAALAADATALVEVPSVTGAERAVMERFAALAGERGLTSRVVEHDLAALRADPAHPGEEAPRDEIFSAVAVAPGGDGPRLCLCGHLDVVEPWEPARTEGGRLYGRGSVDMKSAVAAALHAAAAINAAGGAAGEIVVLAVASEEDGGLGAFAALRDDADYVACVIPEPTAFNVACAQAGALTFTGVVPGVAAHAAVRLEGISAIDRYVEIHRALAELEAELNRDVEHPLMAELELPYALSVGRVAGGNWSSTVPERLEFEGRVGVPVGTDPAAIRERLEAAVDGACPEASIAWSGGAFASGQTPADHPIAQLALAATAEELGRPARAVGVPYGADMRLFCERGIPTVMVGTPGLERAHAVDEHVELSDLEALARILVRICARFWD
jgi:acetylornithine deacetylase